MPWKSDPYPDPLTFPVVPQSRMPVGMARIKHMRAGAAPFCIDRAGSCWLMTHSLNVAVRIHPGGAVSLSAAFRNSDIKFIPPPGRLPCRNSSRFLRTAGKNGLPTLKLRLVGHLVL